ncbi:hypothetical protein HY418_03070 [Candidatus Kaiserbacteria bacterium]|nr:hypothetical protein [Candidatus Kaiserbacteria bacterium]
MNAKLSAGIAGALALSIALPVFAQGVGANINVRAGSTTARTQTALEARIATGKDRAGREIERRITMLNALNKRIQAMLRVSTTRKAGTSAAVEAEIADLTSLKAKIDADTDIESLRADIKSIATSYRIFALVVPQTRIIVAADKLQTTAAMMATFADKLQIRISAAQTSGNDVTALSQLLSDMSLKITDAQTLAADAISLVADLQPDNGDKAVQESNTAAMREARTKIEAALADLRTARKDAGEIVKALRKWTVDTQGPTTSVSGSGSGSASGGTQ